MLSTCLMLESHSAASFVKRELLSSWFAMVVNGEGAVDSPNQNGKW